MEKENILIKHKLLILMEAYFKLVLKLQVLNMCCLLSGSQTVQEIAER